MTVRPFPGEPLGQHPSRPRPGARPGPDGSPGQVQVLKRGAAVGMAARRAEQEVLAQVMAAADLVAADEVGVVRLKLCRRDDPPAQDFRPRSRRITLQNVQRAFGKRLRRRGPIGRRDLPGGIAPDRARRHPHLKPEDVFPVRRAAGILPRGLAHHQNRLVRQKARRGLLIGPRHLVEAGRKMDIGEAVQMVARRPVRQAIHRQMDHHRARRMAEPLHRLVEGGLRRPGQPHQARGRDARDHRPCGRHLPPVRQFDPGRAAAVMQDARNRNPGLHHAAARLDGGDKGADDRIRTALADHHSESLTCHAFEIGKQPAASDVGCEIKMQAPRTQHGLHLGRFKGLRQELAGGLEQELFEVQATGNAAAAKCFEHEGCNCTKPDRATQKPEERFGLRRKARQKRFPCRGIPGRMRGDGGSGLGQIGRDAGPGPVRKSRGEGARDRHEFGPLLRKFRAICPEKRRSGEKRQVHRRPVVAVAGQGGFAGLHRPTRH